jgi:hypothetical protein
MRIPVVFGIVLFAGCATAALAHSETYNQAATTTTTTEVRPVMVTGEIVRYEPQRVIVLRLPDAREVTYTLTPSLTIPSGVAVGRRVTLYTEPATDGNVMVKRIVTTSVTPEGNVQRTTTESRTNELGETSTTSTTEITGTVQAFEAGRSITVTRPDGTQVTYTLTPQSHIPTGLAIGRHVVIYPVASTITTDQPSVDRIVYTKTKVKHGKVESETKVKKVHH